MEIQQKQQGGRESGSDGGMRSRLAVYVEMSLGVCDCVLRSLNNSHSASFSLYVSLYVSLYLSRSVSLVSSPLNSRTICFSLVLRRSIDNECHSSQLHARTHRWA